MKSALLLKDEFAFRDPLDHRSDNKFEPSSNFPEDVKGSQILLGLLKAGAGITFDNNFDWNNAAAEIGVASGSVLKKQWSLIKDSNEGLQPICQIITPIVSRLPSYLTVLRMITDAYEPSHAWILIQGCTPMPWDYSI